MGPVRFSGVFKEFIREYFNNISKFLECFADSLNTSYHWRWEYDLKNISNLTFMRIENEIDINETDIIGEYQRKILLIENFEWM